MLALENRTFGKWTVIDAGKSQYCLCKCECGTEKAVYRYDLIRGSSKQCERCNKFKHGHKVGYRASPTYTSWMCMIRRCEDPSVNDYRRYGGSGVTVCKRWHEFELFLEDMGERPKNHLLDRKETSGNYEPSNCRWVTPKESANNRSNNKHVICLGKRVGLAEGAALIGISYSGLYARMRLLNWPLLDIATLSFRKSPLKSHSP